MLKILNKNRVIIFLSVLLLIMISLFVFQKHPLEPVDSFGTKGVTTSLDSEPMQNETFLQYENTIAKLKSQISELQSTDEKYHDSVQTPSTENFTDIEKEQEKYFLKYTPLFKELGLTSEQSQALIDIFIDQKLEGESIGTKINSMIEIGDVNGDGIPTIIDGIAAIAIGFENDIKEILGETNYEKYQLYEDTYEDRLMLNGFNVLLDDADHLEDEQIAQLAKEFYSIRSKYFYKPTYKIGNHSHVTGVTDEDILSVSPYYNLDPVKASEQMGEEYLEKAKELFSKKQFKIFKTYYNSNFVFR